MAVQQSKVSKRRCRQRKAANRYRGIQTAVCPNCGTAKLSHRACASCGYYKGRQVIDSETA